MASIWKQVLAPGTYHTRTGPVTFTPKHLAEFARNGQAMIAQQLPAVIPLEHQDDALPMTDGERLALQVSRNTGFVTAWRLAGDGTLWAKLSVDWLPDANGDSEIEHRLKNAIKYVSPQITPYLKDGTGKVWRNIISHVALTPTPVWHNQLPFGTDGPALSRGVIR
ncbi:MAG: hypothetical protein JNM56_40695, partial [Planctomycetia bacterium]|nr:hypothetical protein [Planctomycetia bacterium]